MSYEDCIDNIKSGWWGKWEKECVLEEFVEISEYLMDMECIRCYDLCLKEDIVENT